MKKVLFGLAPVIALALAAPAVAMTEKVIFTFSPTGDNGFSPKGPLVPDGPGGFYGLTSDGGIAGQGPVSAGVVYKLTPPAKSGGAWMQTVLHVFGSTDGVSPQYLIVAPSDKLYGITTHAAPFVTGPFGTVWELTPPVPGGPASASNGCGGCWTETILYATSTGGLNALALGPNGDLFGTLISASPNPGTVFKLSPPAQAGGAWAYTPLYTLPNASEGENPTGFTIGSDGALYGLTNSYGDATHPATIFRLVPPAPGSAGPWIHQVLHEFINGSWSYSLSGPLTQFYRGSLYGVVTTADETGGLVFQLTQPYASGGAGWRYSVLYTFATPIPGRLYFPTGLTLPYGSGGKLYGTTVGIRASAWVLVPPSPPETAWRYQTLFPFQNDYEGRDPFGPLFVQSQTVYGTARFSLPTGAPIIYQLTPPLVP